MSSFLRGLTWALTALAVLLNVFIYFYPHFNEASQCQWYTNDESSQSKKSVLSSIAEEITAKVSSKSESPEFRKSVFDASGKIQDIRMLTFGDPQINGNWPSTKYIKRLDNYGNDYYLGHIYSIMKSRMQPTHVAVMGDLFSSQWIYDSEFYNRTYRYVTRLFPRPESYKQTVLDTYKKHENYDWQAWMGQEEAMDPVHRFESRVYNDVYDWTLQNVSYPLPSGPDVREPLFINLTGNHDIGYSGDATWQHMARFHLLFGQNNYVINYNKGTPYEWRLVVLDSLTLEGPALQEEFVDYTWSFLENLKERENPSFKGSTVLLTHIPFYKPEGFCTDGPQHIYYENNEREPYKNGKLRSQNHLARDVSQKVIDIVFPNADKEGIVLNGHDHEGCDNYYQKSTESGLWEATKEISKDVTTKPIREIVVRSMMGDFNGNTGIMTGVFNETEKTWEFHFALCPFVVQHWWWVTKIITGLTVILQSYCYLKR
ncbi:protein Ted1p [[Candida] anglica]